MSTETPTQGKRTAYRPTYFSLGTDAEGAHYCADTTGAFDTVHVIRDGERVKRYALRHKTIDHFFAAVADSIGWETKDYGLGAVVERAEQFA